jgi:uncharacterized membrane protein required for colicin V production
MAIVDILIVVLILLFGLYGYHTGFIKTVVGTVGLIVVFVLAFLFKDPLAEWLSFNLPFFDLPGFFKGISVLNVVIYQLIAFIIVFFVLMIVFALVIKLSGLIEKILKWTIVLRLPSKILGFIVGIMMGIVVASSILMIVSLPVFNFEFVHESKVKNFLMEVVPITGTLSSDTNKAINEIMDLKKVYNDNENKDEFNSKSLDILLKYNIINVDYAKKLIDSQKLIVKDGDKIINKYK